MSKEVPLQVDMFSGELIDTRTRKQKKREAELKKPVQTEMFSQRELAQFGVRANPQIPISPKTRIELALQDLRTEEEKEEARQLEIERRSYRLPGFEDVMAPSSGDESITQEEIEITDSSDHGE
jgi:preprotein translocase subunit SecF